MCIAAGLMCHFVVMPRAVMCKHAPGFSIHKKAVPLQSRKLVLKDVGLKYSCSESVGIEMLLTGWCSSRNS